MKSLICNWLFIVFAISNRNSQSEAFNSLNEDALSYVQSQVKVINSTIQKDLEFRHEFRKTVVSLDAELAQILTSVYLKENIEKLEGIYEDGKKQSCFKVLQNVKENVHKQAKSYFESCVSHFKYIEAFEGPILGEWVRAINNSENIAENCKETQDIVESERCVTRATLDFLGIMSDMSWILERLKKHEYNINKLTKCITGTTNKAGEIVSFLNRDIINCIIGTSEDIHLLDYLDKLNDVPSLLDDVFIDQVNYFDIQTEPLIQTIEEHIRDLNKIISRIIKMKSLSSNNTCQNFTKDFNNSVETILAETDPSPDLIHAALCVSNYYDVIYGICISRKTEMQNCSEAITDIKLKEVLQVEQKFTKFKHYNKIFRLNCLGKGSNLFPVGGIRNCLQDKSVNNFLELSQIEERFYYFLMHSRETIKLLEECTSLAENRSHEKESAEEIKLKMCLNVNTE